MFLLPGFCLLAATLPDYPARKAADCAVTTEKDGLTIGVQPVEDQKDQKTYFGTEFGRKGFIPAFVVLENKTGGDSFLFDKAKITYGPTDSTASAPDVSSKAGQKLNVASIALGSPLGMIIAMKLKSNALQIQENILKKEIQSKTLSPGASAHGFLYLQVEKTAQRQKIHLHVPVDRAGSDERAVLDIVF